MANLMKTTLNIDDQVMKRLKEEAARRDRTMSELVEAGLRTPALAQLRAPENTPTKMTKTSFFLEICRPNKTPFSTDHSI